MNRNIFHYNYTAAFYLMHPVSFLKETGRRVKWAKQRITRGYCSRDIWNLNTYMSILLPDMLRDLVRDSKGIVDDQGMYFEKALAIADKLETAQELEDDSTIGSYAQALLLRQEALNELAEIWNYLWW